MIRPVDTSTPSAATPPGTTPAAATTGTSFADLHTAALKKTATPATPEVSVSDETWTPVPGVSSYAKITSGERAGQYIDLSKGKLHLQTFTIEQRDGKTVHVYKSSDGKEQVVDPTAAKKAKHASAAATPPKGEKWGPVDGHSGYADILSGKRNGLYVNTSGGARTGMAFQLVKKGDKELHIYGEGANRQVIAVPVKHAEKTATEKTAAPKSTGGASAK